MFWLTLALKEDDEGILSGPVELLDSNFWVVIIEYEYNTFCERWVHELILNKLYSNSIRIESNHKSLRIFNLSKHHYIHEMKKLWLRPPDKTTIFDNRNTSIRQKAHSSMLNSAITTPISFIKSKNKRESFRTLFNNKQFEHERDNQHKYQV